MSIETLRKDLDRLQVDPRNIYLKFRSLQGTRHIIQYENPEYVFTMSKTFKPKIECYGVTNRCQDGKFVLFLDYDKIYKELMYKNLNNLLKTFPKSLSNFYIAKTEPEEELEDGKIKGSYHAINFAKNYKYQIDEFLKVCDIDPYFVEIPKKTAHKCHVLRTSKKYWKIGNKEQKQEPKFIEKYPRKAINPRVELSNAHYKFFTKTWNITEPFKKQAMKFDKLTKIELHKYSTPKC